MPSQIKPENLIPHDSIVPMLGRKALLVIVVTGLIASMTFIVAVAELPHQQQVAAKRVDHTLEVLAVATQLDADRATAIAEARGFIIDRKTESGARFNDAANRVTGDLVSLRALTVDNATQQSALGRIEPLIVTRIALIREVIERLNMGDLVSGPRVSTLRQTALELTEQIVAATNAFQAEETRLLALRRANARRIMRIWLGASLGCGILAAASGFFAASLLVIRTRRGKHLAELRKLNAGLEERVQARNAQLSKTETDFRLLAEHLQVSETRYRLFADSTNDVIIYEYLDLVRTYVSPASRMVFGYGPEEMVRDKAVASPHEDDLATVLAAVHQLTVGTAERTLVTYRAQHKHGHWIWIEATVSLVRDAITGIPSSLVCSLRDISERHAHADELHATNLALQRLTRHLAKARDVAEQASQAKSRFLAGMSHELRTPLNGVLGYAQLLRMEGGLTVAQLNRVEAMLTAGKHLLEMIRTVLDLSEIETARFELQMADVDVRPLAAACVDLVRSDAESKNLGLTMVVALDVPGLVVTDPTRLRQLLLNLLGNAVKFTARGAVELRVRVAGDSAHLRFEVADTGPGISTEQSQRLFHDFERLETAATRAVEGAGLGLYISAQLTARMGGRIGHDVNPTGGSIFWFELPTSPAVAATSVAVTVAPVAAMIVAAVGDRPALQQTRTSERVLHVLVVDDVLMNRDIASSFLRMAGHTVICANSGAEAVAAAGNTDFDVILMDVYMPGMDGLEATRRIRAGEEPGRRVPIMALTAQAFTEQVAACRNAGMDSHLAKPFDADMLIAAVVSAAANEPACILSTAPASPPGILIAASRDASTIGADRPVFNVAVFDRTAAYLAPAAVLDYLQTIAVHAETLLKGLHGPDAFTTGYEGDLAEAAHILAGTAGMFGFDRVSTMGRHFEHAFQMRETEKAAFGTSLSDALEATLLAIHHRAPTVTEAEAASEVAEQAEVAAV